MGFRRNPLKNNLLETNPHTHAMKASQQTVIVAPAPPKAHSASIKCQARNEDEIRPPLGKRSIPMRLANSKAPLHKFGSAFHKVEAQTGFLNARKDDFFTSGPGCENIRLGG